MRPIRVMFVCLGNICRSPLAHGIFEHLVAEAGLSDQFTVASSGLGAWHVGELPDPRMRRTALRNGINLDYQRAQQLVPNDLGHYDHMYTMDRSIQRGVVRMGRQRRLDAEVQLFSQFDPDPNTYEVPDPYFDGRFDHVYTLVERTCRAILEDLINRYNLRPAI